MSFDPSVHMTGWIDDPARHPMTASFARPLAQVAPRLMNYGVADNIFLYRAWKEVLGDYPAYVAQQIGDCTSFGSGHAVDLLQCVEIVAGEPSEYKEVCTEAIYGMGREIAGMLGGGDGCYGSAVSKALVTMGAVTREMVGPYSGRRAKEWGARGVPADVKKDAEPYKVGASALITTLEELDASLDSGYPSAGGFSQGFVMKRDQDGVCLQSGRWGHEQCCIGRRKRGDRRQYLLGQSWGPNVPDGPLTDDQPNFSFWIWDTHMLDILKQRDWFTFSKAPDFVRRPLPAAWTTRNFI